MYGEQMVRMLRAVDLLSTPAGATKQKLAERLGVDMRTVERLLGLLQELNFPIYDEQDSLSGKKYWKLVDTYVMKLPNITLPDIRLTLAEIIALYLMKGEANLFHGTEIEKMADSAITAYDEIRTLAVERIERLEVTDISFEYPAGFDPEKLLGSAFGIIFDKPIQVKIRFSREVAPYITERTWAPNQRIRENEAADGSILLEMETGGWLDVKRWVLSYGMQAEVLEPTKMREEILEELKSCIGKYQPGV
jgi:predicted DNA-binding transcriptional regulator YafY